MQVHVVGHDPARPQYRGIGHLAVVAEVVDGGGQRSGFPVEGAAADRLPLTGLLIQIAELQGVQIEAGQVRRPVLDGDGQVLVELLDVGGGVSHVVPDRVGVQLEKADQAAGLAPGAVVYYLYLRFLGQGPLGDVQPDRAVVGRDVDIYIGFGPGRDLEIGPVPGVAPGVVRPRYDGRHLHYGLCHSRRICGKHRAGLVHDGGGHDGQ